MLIAMRCGFTGLAGRRWRAFWRHTPRRANRALTDDAGFTLVEIIAALAILSLSLTLLFSSMSEGFHRQQRAKTTTEASLQAQSLLARVGTELALSPGQSKGDLQNGYRWEMQIMPLGNAADAQQWPVAAYKLEIKVFAGMDVKRPVTTLTTLRLGPKGATR